MAIKEKAHILLALIAIARADAASVDIGKLYTIAESQ
jgi:hypothetical protein